MREAASPVKVLARGARRPSSPPGLWDNLSAIVNFESGAHLTVTQSLATAEHHMSAKVVGAAGAALAFWDGEMDRTEHPVCSLKVVRDGILRDIPIEASGEFFSLPAQCRPLASL